MADGGIGIFDSGIGGLTLLRECERLMQGETFYYYGDNKNAPYGNKSADEILSLVLPAFDLFASLKVKAVLIACNTVTAECAAFLRRTYPFPVFGLEPALKPAAARYDDILVLATKATIESPSFRRLKNRFSGKNITAFAPVSLAGEIEKNIFSLGRINLDIHLPPLSPQAVVLGCTHYLFLKDVVSSYYRAPVFDGNAGLVHHFVNTFAKVESNERKGKDIAIKNNIIFIKDDNNINFSVHKQMFAS